jgi:hypothetical protein
VVEEDRNARIELILGLFKKKYIYISLGKMYVFFFIYSFGFN